jgi:hypothetical protein
MFDRTRCRATYRAHLCFEFHLNAGNNLVLPADQHGMSLELILVLDLKDRIFVVFAFKFVVNLYVKHVGQMTWAGSANKRLAKKLSGDPSAKA